MKKIHFSLSLIIISFSSFAQLQDASFIVGGSAGLHSEPVNPTTKFTNYSIQPVLAYVLAEDKVLGLALSYSGNKIEFAPDAESKSTNIEAGVFYRKYSPITEKLFFNWKIAAGILSEKRDGAMTETNSLGFGARFSPGLTWTATDKLLVVSRVGNLSYFQKTGEVEGGVFTLNFNSLSLGLEFLLK